MALNPIAAAIPVFFALIAVEAGIAWWMGRKVYRFDDAIAALSCGISSQIAGLFTKALTLAAYVGVWSNLRLFELPDTHWGTWVFAFVAVDLAYYAWHRWTHSSGIGWASHVVHHHSEHYNLAVALRQSMSSSLTSWPFYLPLAILGVSPLVAGTCIALNTLYQFWIHTELIGRMGPLEWVMNTPSHHRVHHGINPRYLDKNHAGVFIVWDRLFGTFEAETEAPIYGTVTPLRSWNPLWANVAWVVTMARASRAARTWGDALGVWWRGPGFAEAVLRGSDAPAPRVGGYAPQVPEGVVVYVALHFLPVAVVTTWLIQAGTEGPVSGLLGPVLWVLLATVSWGGLLEGKGWALPVEVVRLLGLGVLVALRAGHPAEALVGAVWIGGSVLWIVPRIHPRWVAFRRGLFA